MKNFFSKASLMLIAMLSSMFFVSCSDDETPEAPKAKIETIKPSYSVYLSDDYLAIYDAEVVYGYGDAVVTTEAIEGNEWSYSDAVKASAVNLPTNFFCKVVLTQKQDIEIDVTKKYVLEYSYSLDINGIKTNNESVSLGHLQDRSSMTLRDSKIKEYFDLRKVITVCNFDCEVK